MKHDDSLCDAAATVAARDSVESRNARANFSNQRKNNALCLLVDSLRLVECRLLASAKNGNSDQVALQHGFRSRRTATDPLAAFTDLHGLPPIEREWRPANLQTNEEIGMSRMGSIGLVIVGVLFLLHNLGVLRFSQISGMLLTWWPLILIAVGVAGLIGKRK